MFLEQSNKLGGRRAKKKKKEKVKKRNSERQLLNLVESERRGLCNCRSLLHEVDRSQGDGWRQINPRLGFSGDEDDRPL